MRRIAIILLALLLCRLALAEETGIGYPIWHGATPRPVLTFLESYDLSGKKLVPFNTHEGSGQSGTVSEIAASAPGAEMLDGIAIQGKVAQEDAEHTGEMLADWLCKTGLY